jgi:hypothetical protein
MMTIGTEAFIRPLKSVPVSLSNGVTYDFSARFLENDLWQPVITHLDFVADSGAISLNQEGLLLLEANSTDDDSDTVAHALFSKYGPVVLLLEIFTNLDDGRIEIEQIFWDSTERLTSMEITFPNEMDVVRDALLPAIPVKSKFRGIAEILIREHFERKRAKALSHG